MAGLSDEHQSSMHFLLRALSLQCSSSGGNASASARWTALLELAGRGDGAEYAKSSQEVESTTKELHGRVCHALEVAGVDSSRIAVELISDLLERDAVNGYGIAAAEAGPDGDRHPLRGAAIYAAASRINHECLPNVARFDDFDAPAEPGAAPGANCAMRFRAMHALPPGEELTQSYFPLTWTFAERQQRCRGHYGFDCICPRCVEEATWGGEREGQIEGGQGTADPAYIHLFLLKYVCPREGCGGTMAPLFLDSSALECNVCGGTRTEAEFLGEVERDMGGRD